ncbi:probable RNA polymerase II nuclear localization protein SLC7A6OS [Anoplolepis gracilipes]|uniref:probable RNA polymerase II nuclear localization protein SLC7A6OS n=1 Tax=Anoplolepis gracilipes TaxID=354296 RepID=UPI003B9E385B
MTAVLRVKRKNSDSPLDKLVIACKRARTGSPVLDESEPAIQTVVQFAGTLTDPTEDVAQHVAKVMPQIHAELVKIGVKRTCDASYSANISNKKWIGADPLVERYKVVNCQRSQDMLNEEKTEDKWLTLIDVEDSWSVSGTAKQNAQQTEDIEDFVFDLYCGPTNDEDVWFENNEILVQEPPDYPYYDADDVSEASSEDSNAESNWRNDYPDTDFSDEDYDSDCSNDDEDEYSYIDPREEEDKEIYGRSYAEYRKIIQAEYNDDSNSNLSDDEGRSSNYSSDESMGIL